MSNISWGVRIALTATLLVALSNCAAMQRQTLPNFSEKAKILYDALSAYQRGDYGTWFAGQMSLAEKDDPYAQGTVAFAYRFGRGVTRNRSEAERWYRRAAERGNQGAKYFLKKDSEGNRPQNLSELADWVRPDAERGVAIAQWVLTYAYINGFGVPKNPFEAAKWAKRGARQGYPASQFQLATMYLDGMGVPQDYVQAHKWLNLGVSRLLPSALRDNATAFRDHLAQYMSRAQFVEAQRLAGEWRPQREEAATVATAPPSIAPAPTSALAKHSTGSGIAVSREGHILTNYHVVEKCREVRIAPNRPTERLASDARNDLALLKTPQGFPKSATFRGGRGIRLGDGVVVAGFPLAGLLASDLNISTGVVGALAGPGGDTTVLQITAPIQQGNSGGPLLDLSGNLVGVVVAKLDALKVAILTGDIPQNVNFAISASTAKAFLDAHGIPYDTSPSTRGPNEMTAADVAARARDFTVLVECWR